MFLFLNLNKQILAESLRLLFYFAGDHSDLNFTVNGSTIHFVEKENIMRYNIDNINNICKTSHSKPQIVKLWYQDGSWKDDLDSLKVYSQIIYIEKKQVFQIDFSFTSCKVNAFAVNEFSR